MDLQQMETRRQSEEANRLACLREQRLKLYLGEAALIALLAAGVVLLSIAWQHVRG